jgi:hypothetical protein
MQVAATAWPLARSALKAARAWPQYRGGAAATVRTPTAERRALSGGTGAFEGLHSAARKRGQNPRFYNAHESFPRGPFRPLAQPRRALAWAHGARFLTTASQLDQLPAGELPEIAFVGRSNAGKSSAINALAQQKRLAFASRTPGRTQHINLFELGPKDAADACSPTCPATATPPSSAPPSCAGRR